MPTFDGMVEPEITINGKPLSFAQAMTVRVAVENLALFISDLPAEQRTGVFSDSGYLGCINKIREYIFANQPAPKGSNADVEQGKTVQHKSEADEGGR